MRFSCKSGGCSGRWHPLPSSTRRPQLLLSAASWPDSRAPYCGNAQGATTAVSGPACAGGQGLQGTEGSAQGACGLATVPQASVATPRSGAHTPSCRNCAEEVRRQPRAHCSARTGHHQEGTRPTRQGGVRGSQPLLHGPSTPETPLSWEQKQLPPSEEGQRFISHFPIIVAGERMNSWLLKRFCPFLTGSV